MAVRNFWVECFIDGRETPLRGGPRTKDGGMSINLFVRDRGTIKKICAIGCIAKGEKLKTNIHLADGRFIELEETER